MATCLITGRLQQWSNACRKQFYEKKRLHAVYKLQKDVCHNLWRAQTALIPYTRGPAELLLLLLILLLLYSMALTVVAGWR